MEKSFFCIEYNDDSDHNNDDEINNYIMHMFKTFMNAREIWKYFTEYYAYGIPYFSHNSTSVI